ncbi:MAG: molecular chaperone HtpG, partial [Lachnospiraceae bacterium]|nr:molecular chaperone HtpG [Lachnospiraceae bacterium]
AKMQAFVMNQNIDQPFISQLEAKNEGLHFARIDADVTEALKSRTGKKAAEELKKQEESLSESVKKTLKDEQITVSLQKLKDKKIAALLTVNEQSRRMADMMKMYAANGMDLGAFGKEGRTLVLNANHPLVKYLLEHQEEEKAGLVLEQFYDLAKLQNAPLEADEMTRFVERSNKVLLMMTEEA